MSANFKLVPKLDGNIGSIWFVLPNGEGREICRIVFLTDNQVNDNVEALNSIMAVLRKRIRRSF